MTTAHSLFSLARIPLLPLALSVLVIPAVASADDAGDTATARALGIEGITLADAGKCKEALGKLERAEKLHHAPSTAAWLGECEIDQGKLVTGSERLQRVVHEPLPLAASPAFTAAVARAQKTLDSVLPRIPQLRIGVSAPPGVKYAVVIDGDAVPDAVVDTDRPTDPGQHVIQVTARGFFPSSATVTLAEGQSRKVALELKPDPNARLAAQAAAAPRDPADSGPSRAPALAAFGFGALGLGVGIAGGIAAASRSSALSSACDANKVCPADRQSDIDAGKRWSTVSTAGFIVAGAAGATGIVLWLVGNGNTTEQRAGFRARPVVGAGYAGIDGAF